MRVSLDSLHSADIDIICFSLSRWDAPVSSPGLSIAKELGKTNRVFYLDHPFSWKDYYKEKKTPAVKHRKKALLGGEDIYSFAPGFTPHLIAVTCQLIYPVNFLPPGKLYNRLSRLNNNIVLKTLRRVIIENDIKNFVFINFFDPFYLGKLPADIRPFKYIYHCMDDLSQVYYTQRHGVQLEEEIIRKSDITLCTSRELARLKSAFSPNVHFYPNGADIKLFRQAADKTLERPEDMPSGSKKIIGWIGSIDYRADVELLKKLADHHHDKILFLLGPVMGNEHVNYQLHLLPNVIFAGARKPDELPAYLQYFDCCIIPYKKDTLTRSIYPLKINEYLAAGKPVVATNFSEDILSFREVAEVVDSHEEFIDAIDRVIREDEPVKKLRRIEVAATNSWENRAELFWKILNGRS